MTHGAWIGLVFWAAGAGELASTDESSVAELRREVDRLAVELANEREDSASELKALAVQRQDLERELRREKVRAATLLKLRRARRSEANDARRAEVVRALVDGIGAASRYLDRVVAFRLDERRAELDRVQRNLEDGKVSLAAEGLWQFFEDEELLSREVELTEDVIELDGESLRVEALHIGHALLYYRDAQGRTAYAVRDGDEWRIRRVDDPALAEAIAACFAAVAAGSYRAPLELVLPP